MNTVDVEDMDSEQRGDLAADAGGAKVYNMRTRRNVRSYQVLSSDEEEEEEELQPGDLALDQTATDVVAAGNGKVNGNGEEIGEEEERQGGEDGLVEDELGSPGKFAKLDRNGLLSVRRKRLRKRVEFFDPSHEPTISRRRRSRDAALAEGEEEEEEEEIIEDERMKPIDQWGRYSADHKYSTRFRNTTPGSLEEEEDPVPMQTRRTTRIRQEVQRYSPCHNQHEQGSPTRRRGFSKRSRGGVSSSYRDRYSRDSSSRYGSRRRMGGDSDDDLIQDRNDHLWGLLSEAAQQDAAANPGGVGAPMNIPQANASVVPGNPFAAFGNMMKPAKNNVEITPISVDSSITFSDIGGLEHYVHSLKEMVFLPLVYPEVFRKFHLNPPKGVLLHGPPGTGKTLCARALAAAAKRSGQNVSFFMRKGADVLSKWVGESERQLRLLFEEAQKRQPSIIFFDEIDGLCPVRSSKQDQIHNSIVSTLLALMDGLDNRGQVVIIGATNRIDAVDSALRRPGRFDRELSFPLPNVKARKEILGIHTKKWQKPVGEELKQDLATACVGYCGADLKALCTEATLQALRRHYPQIYKREEKLVIDTEKIEIGKEDFISAQKSITPASQRSAVVHAQPLPKHLSSCLADEMDRLREVCAVLFNSAEKVLSDKLADRHQGQTHRINYAQVLRDFTCRSRLCICGDTKGLGQELLAPSLLHDLEAMPCFAIGHPDLLSFAGAHTPEEALVSIVCEARKAAPSILYLSNCDIWWSTSSYLLRSTFLALMSDLLSSNVPLLFLATSDCNLSEMQEDLGDIFCGNSFSMRELGNAQKLSCYEDVSKMIEEGYQGKTEISASAELEDLPLAPPEEQVLQGKALELKMEEEKESLRQLRMLFRNQILKLLCEHRWRVFSEPLREHEKKDCEEKSCKPMDLLSILRLVDAGELNTVQTLEKSFSDIVATTEVLYSSNIAEEARTISRAHNLKDTVALWIKTLPKDLVDKCDDIRKKREEEARRKEEEENAQRRSSSRRRGEIEDDWIVHMDPEAMARKLRQEKRLAEEQEASKAPIQEEGTEMEVDESNPSRAKVDNSAQQGEAGAVGAAGVAASAPTTEPQQNALVTSAAQSEGQFIPLDSEHLAAFNAALSLVISKMSLLNDLDSLHACLKQLAWSYRMEPNRNNVAKGLTDFLEDAHQRKSD